jgi:hypothetical protein
MATKAVLIAEGVFPPLFDGWGLCGEPLQRPVPAAVTPD